MASRCSFFDEFKSFENIKYENYDCFSNGSNVLLLNYLGEGIGSVFDFGSAAFAASNMNKWAFIEAPHSYIRFINPNICPSQSWSRYFLPVSSMSFFNISNSRVQTRYQWDDPREFPNVNFVTHSKYDTISTNAFFPAKSMLLHKVYTRLEK